MVLCPCIISKSAKGSKVTFFADFTDIFIRIADNKIDLLKKIPLSGNHYWGKIDLVRS